MNAVDPIELQYWCKELKCTEEDLLKAIGRWVGEHVTEVRQFLASPGLAPVSIDVHCQMPADASQLQFDPRLEAQGTGFQTETDAT